MGVLLCFNPKLQVAQEVHINFGDKIEIVGLYWPKINLAIIVVYIAPNETYASDLVFQAFKQLRDDFLTKLIDNTSLCFSGDFNLSTILKYTSDAGSGKIEVTFTAHVQDDSGNTKAGRNATAFELLTMMEEYDCAAQINTGTFRSAVNNMSQPDQISSNFEFDNVTLLPNSKSRHSIIDVRFTLCTEMEEEKDPAPEGKYLKTKRVNVQMANQELLEADWEKLLDVNTPVPDSTEKFRGRVVDVLVKHGAKITTARKKKEGQLPTELNKLVKKMRNLRKRERS